ncbi:hypothetical protein LCGC14_1548830, partial [marine sediment metagenome]
MKRKRLVSKTALDLSRALGRLVHKRLESMPVPEGNPHVHVRLHRLARGIGRLAERLRAIPADAVRQIAVSKKWCVRWRQECLTQFNQAQDALVMEFGRRSGKTEMQEAEVERLRKGGADVAVISSVGAGAGVSEEQTRALLKGVERSIDEKWTQLASGEHEWKEEPDCALCAVCISLCGGGGDSRKKCEVCVLPVQEKVCFDEGHPYDMWSHAVKHARLFPVSLVSWRVASKAPNIRAAAQKVLDLLREKRGELRAQLAGPTEGEKRVRAMSTELLERNLPAVALANGQWHAMAKGLLEKKPDCPMCKMLYSVSDCRSKCTLFEYAHTWSARMPLAQNKCGPEYVYWVHVMDGAGDNLHDPAVMAAAGEMAELLDRLHVVIKDELKKRAKDLATEWHEFKLKERVRLKWGSEGVVVGGDGLFVTVKPNERDNLVYITPGDLERVTEEPALWNDEFNVGDRLKHVTDGKGTVVDARYSRVRIRLDNGRWISCFCAERLSRVQEWHGFEEGEKVIDAHHGDCTVVGPDVRSEEGDKGVFVTYRDSHGALTRVAAWLFNLSRPHPAEPDNLCSTCARHDHNDSRYDDSCFQGYFPAPHCDAWVQRVPAEDRRCRTCAYWPKGGPPNGYDKGTKGSIQCDANLPPEDDMLMSPHA